MRNQQPQPWRFSRICLRLASFPEVSMVHIFLPMNKFTLLIHGKLKITGAVSCLDGNMYLVTILKLMIIMKLNVKLMLLMLAIGLFLPEGICGQELLLRGRVTTYDSIPLMNVEVTAKSTGAEVVTDSLGKFALECLNDDKLIFNAKSFKRKTVNLKEDETFLDVNLELKEGERYLELALGPDGYIREADKQKVSTINDRKVDFSMYSTIYDALRGRVAGVNIVGDIVYIRGQTTIGSGDAEALFVVDGVIVSKFVFSSIPTSDIQNIRVLKGSAASIYGSRGGNGVIEVDTKRGKFK
ncbi:MAG TPA: hypothetical protein ENH59_04325 [Bacteroidetes bacterium]|nr:hypothetical protein [Bacteroidota bacterium]